MQPIKEKESILDEQEELIQEKGPNLSMEKIMSSLVKEYVAHLRYPL